MTRRTCDYPGCSHPHEARGLCKAHYSQLRRGRPLSPVRWRASDAEGQPLQRADAFWSRVDRGEGCWLWTSKKTPAGYGQFQHEGVIRYAHRVSYEMTNGTLNPGQVVDHLCHNTSCVNPAHLRAATQPQNLQNRRGAASSSKSGVRNVHQTRSGSWRAKVRKDGRDYRRVFPTIEEAEEWATEMRGKLFSIPRPPDEISPRQPRRPRQQDHS